MTQIGKIKVRKRNLVVQQIIVLHFIAGYVNCIECFHSAYKVCKKILFEDDLGKEEKTVKGSLLSYDKVHVMLLHNRKTIVHNIHRNDKQR